MQGRTPSAARVASKALQAAGNYTRIVMFDFDGTLFRSDEATPSWWAKPGAYSWGSDPRSLDEPCVPSRPGAAYWNSHVVAAARQATRDPTTFVILVTGRVKGHEPRIRELLGQAGISVDALRYNPGMNAATFKKKVFSSLIVTYPYVDRLEVWENENMSVYEGWIRRVSETLDRNISIEVFPVREVHIPAACGPEDFARVASNRRWWRFSRQR